MIGIVIGLIFLGFLLAIPVAVIVVVAQGKAKKRAYALLDERVPDPGEIRKVIQTLSRSKDTEHQELVRKLMARLTPPRQRG